LDGADASRSDALSGDQELPRVAADAAEHRQGIPGRDDALQGRTRAPPGSRVSICAAATPALERDGFSLNRHRALDLCWSMIFSENRLPLFRIMLQIPVGA